MRRPCRWIMVRMNGHAAARVWTCSCSIFRTLGSQIPNEKNSQELCEVTFSRYHTRANSKSFAKTTCSKESVI